MAVWVAVTCHVKAAAADADAIDAVGFNFFADLIEIYEHRGSALWHLDKSRR